MTDRELLTLAAKAAGMDCEWREGCSAQTLAFVKPRGFRHYWRPLTDDGDALRLAAACRIDVLFDGTEIEVPCVEAIQSDYADVRPFAIEALDADPYAATRRAIVRAAAEIGRRLP